MRQRRWLIAGAIAAVAAAAWWYTAMYGWTPVASTENNVGVQFRYLGCDDWPDDLSIATSVEATPAPSGVVYHVTDPAACGYSVRRPKFRLTDNELKLAYELYTPGDELAACICRYRSEFRFDRDPGVANVTFSASSPW